MTCQIALGAHYAQLDLHVLFTPPGTVARPALGRRDFFAQVDFALSEAERLIYLRFRDRSAIEPAW